MEPRFLPLFFLIAAMPEIHAQLTLPPDTAYVVPFSRFLGKLVSSGLAGDSWPKVPQSE